MKNLMTFESFNNGIFTKEEKDIFTKWKEINDFYDIYFNEKEVNVIVNDSMHIEPEEGSWEDRTLEELSISKSGENQYLVNYNYISGMYGCDEQDEDCDIEPEFDWSIQSTSHDEKIKINATSIEELVIKLDEFLRKVR